ncbi:MAG: hypothetical protein HYU41_27750 [Candidatus Rokubacteria bacterium]|nr:hypothetical protein [Candidatus Rokubacteria bacterium]
MRTPIRLVPDAIARWMSRARYLRWLDAIAAWLGLWAVVAYTFPRASFTVAAVAALAAVVALSLVLPIRVRWRPVTGWVGLTVSRSLRPGDRAWWVQPHRSESVVVTALHGVRVTIAMAHHGESEGLTVRRTRALIVPADDVRDAGGRPVR